MCQRLLVCLISFPTSWLCDAPSPIQFLVCVSVVTNCWHCTVSLSSSKLTILFLRHVKAGTELTWDYGYEAGSMPETEISCHCGVQKCRKKTL